MIIPNPCKGICKLHPEKLICVGCHRTRREKILWHSLTDNEKLEVMDLMEMRKEAYGDLNG